MNLNILLIEDNPGDKRLFEEMIKEANLDLSEKLKFYHSPSLENIYKLINENSIDIVFLDLGLPSSNGEETVTLFRQLNKDIPLVAYTGMNDINLGAKLLHLGANDYICKTDATPSLLIKTIWLNLERYKLKQNLDEKEKLLLAQSRSAAMGDMISMIAHQWKQPLSVLGMIFNNIKVDLDLNDTIDKEVFYKYSDDSFKQLDHLATTIDDFQNFFSPNKSKQISTIKQAIEATLKLINKSLENNSVDVILKNEYIQEFEFFSNELTQVLINILKNAKEALVFNNIENRKIIIKTYQQENNAFIEIEDNAGGIPDDILPRVFEPYFTTKEKLNGSGIGLYMSKVIIEDHFNGSIKAINIKNGAKFIITIPISNT